MQKRGLIPFYLMLFLVLNVILFLEAQSSNMKFITHRNSVNSIQNLTTITGIKSSLRCCRLCMTSENCVLVNYNAEYGVCQLSNESSQAFVTVAGWDVFEYVIPADSLNCSAPCFNGGWCASDGVNSFCRCPTGWTGSQCEDYNGSNDDNVAPAVQHGSQGNSNYSYQYGTGEQSSNEQSSHGDDDDDGHSSNSGGGGWGWWKK